MLNLFSTIEYHPNGLTELAYGDGVAYLLHTDYDSLSDTYEIELLINNASYPGSLEKLGKSIYAADHPELTFLVETFINALSDLASSGEATSEDLEDAWDATNKLKQEPV